MKKLLIPLLIIVLIVILIFLWCQNRSASTISTIDIDRMTIQAQGKIKTIDKKEDIETIIRFINSIDKKVVFPSSAKGWSFHIQTKGKREHDIWFKWDRIEIDRVSYKMSTDESDKMGELYNGLNYKEESVVKQLY